MIIGYVYDERRVGIEGIKVRNGFQESITDGDGKFEFNKVDGTVVKIEKPEVWSQDWGTEKSVAELVIFGPGIIRSGAFILDGGDIEVDGGSYNILCYVSGECRELKIKNARVIADEMMIWGDVLVGAYGMLIVKKVKVGGTVRSVGNIEVRGELRSQEIKCIGSKIVLDGEVTGDINLDKKAVLIVPKEGRVVGNVTGGTCQIEKLVVVGDVVKVNGVLKNVEAKNISVKGPVRVGKLTGEEVVDTREGILIGEYKDGDVLCVGRKVEGAFNRPKLGMGHLWKGVDRIEVVPMPVAKERQIYVREGEGSVGTYKIDDNVEDVENDGVVYGKLETIVVPDQTVVMGYGEEIRIPYPYAVKVIGAGRVQNGVIIYKADNSMPPTGDTLKVILPDGTDRTVRILVCGKVEGHVIGEGGKVMEGVEVRLVRGGEVIRRVQTDSRGWYEMPGVKEVEIEYTIEIDMVPGWHNDYGTKYTGMLMSGGVIHHDFRPY